VDVTPLLVFAVFSLFLLVLLVENNLVEKCDLAVSIS
jgi:hypothetical protein